MLIFHHAAPLCPLRNAVPLVGFQIHRHLHKCERTLIRLAKYKQTTKRTWVIERQDVTTLFGNVQTKLRTYGLREYVPPKGLALSVSVSDSYVLDELYCSMIFLHPIRILTMLGAIVNFRS